MKSKELVNHLLVFLSVLVLAVYLTIHAIPQLIYFVKKVDGVGIVVANNNGLLEYTIPNYSDGKKSTFKRIVKNNSYLMGLSTGDKFKLSFLPNYDIIYIEEMDSQFKVFLSLIGLLICYWGIYYFSLKLIGKRKGDVI